MDNNKSLDEIELIAALLCDANQRFGDVFNTRQLRNTIKLCVRRYRREGISFLTKTMPRLDKHFCQVLAGETSLDVSSCGFTTIRDSKLPRFLGELFSQVLRSDGSLLPNPNADCVRMIRDILCAFYKYKLPYQEVQEQKVIDDFLQADVDLMNMRDTFSRMREDVSQYRKLRSKWDPYDVARIIFRMSTPRDEQMALARVVRRAQDLLQAVFSGFDPRDIYPSHGPGVVSTKERLWEKYEWTNVSKRITDYYPFDEYFCSSAGHVCDSYHAWKGITEEDHPAQVILVPKDSRGPRLISCEPVDFQWVQQGLSRAIVRQVERSIARFSVFFTDQVPNQIGALVGSRENRYSTLDLKEASDRVSLELVRLLFPPHLFDALDACRSTSTRLPNGQIVQLYKYAPMGSALCFPVMALTIWSLLTAVACDTDPSFRALYRWYGLIPVSRRSLEMDEIHVYGDDVIVPTGFARSAMAVLELFGLKINRSKSCTQGLFKESCGVDAFKGTNVTPVRIRTVWDESPCPDVYTSWIAYANSYYDRQYSHAYEYIVSRLLALYGPIPDRSMFFKGTDVVPSADRPWTLSEPCPCLRHAPVEPGRFRSRFHRGLQKRQFWVWTVASRSLNHTSPGWEMFLRQQVEGRSVPVERNEWRSNGRSSISDGHPFSVSRYTKRHASMLVRRWR